MRKFFKSIFAIIGLITTLLIGMSALTFFVLGGALHKKKRGPLPSEPLMLLLPLSGRIAERVPSESLSEMVMSEFQGKSDDIYLPTLARELRLAADDAQVAGLFIEIGNLTGSTADFAELRALLSDFKASKKPLHIWLPSAETKEYFLASVADQITMPVSGSIDMPGPTFQMVYFGEGLRKLGVGIDVIRHGQFKSAFEPFVANKPSTDTMLMYNELQTSIFDHLVAAVKGGRTKLKSDAITAFVRTSLHSAREAKELGFIDGIDYAPSAADSYAESYKSKLVDWDDYVADLPEQHYNDDDNGIALIEAVGEIGMNAGGESRTSISYERLKEQLEWARDEDHVKAVVLRISSPGGSALASDLIAEEVSSLAAVKPVIVSMGGVAASGGYYIAAPATHIFASPSTLTGSIGVIGMVPNFEAFADKYGINFHVVTASEHKNLYYSGARMTDNDRSLLLKSVDETYETFLRRVAEGRDMPMDKVRAAAEGRVWSGVQALKVGLVDELGGLKEAIAHARAQATLPADSPVLRWHHSYDSLIDCIAEEHRVRKCLKSSFQETSAAFDSPLLRLNRLIMQATQRDTIQAIWPEYYNAF